MNQDHAITRNAQIARALGNVALDGGILLLSDDEDADTIGMITRFALLMGFETDGITSKTAEPLNLDYLSKLDMPIMFIVTEDEQSADVSGTVKIVQSIQAHGQPNTCWPIVIVTKREREDLGIGLSRGLGIAYRDIYQA